MRLNAELVGEIQAPASDVRSYLAKEIKKLICLGAWRYLLPRITGHVDLSTHMFSTRVNSLTASYPTMCIALDQKKWRDQGTSRLVPGFPC